MSEASPCPWQVRYGDIVADATGARVCGCWRPENAALIVAAVNERDELLSEMNAVRGAARKVVADWQTALDERDKLKAECDRLRDIARRLVRVAQDTLEFAEAMSGIIPDNQERAKARSEITSLLREARAAIGEEAPSAPCAPAPSVVSSSANRTKP